MLGIIFRTIDPQYEQNYPAKRSRSTIIRRWKATEPTTKMSHCKHSFRFSFLLGVLAIRSFVETFNVDFELPISTPNEKFFSADLQRSVRSTKALNPAFQSARQNVRDEERNENFPLSESDWILTESIGDSRSSKRDAIAEKENLKKESFPRKRSRIDEIVEERANDRRSKRRKIARKEIRPKIVELESSDSGENTFYGFFKTDPVEGFPEGDVFVSAGNYPRNSDYDYVQEETGDPKNGNDYHPSYEIGEQFGKPKTSNDRTDSIELWEAEANERDRNGRSRVELNNEDNLRRLTGYHEFSVSPNDRQIDQDTFRFIARPIKAKQIPAELIGQSRSINAALKNVDSLIDDDVRRSKRDKRSPDLRAILEQEMINEDNANSKDCKCRVIRRSKGCSCRPKRGAPESLESETETEMVPGQEMASNLNVADLNSHDVADTEVFSELGDSPMEILKLQTESSNTKIARDAESSKMPQEILKETKTSSKTTLDRDENEFFREFKGTEEEKPSTDIAQDTAQYTWSNWENSTPLGSKMAEDIEVSETSSATFETSTLSDEHTSKEPEDDSDRDKTETEVSPETPVNAEDKPGSSEIVSSKRMKNSSNRKSKFSETRPWESRLFERTKLFLTSRRNLEKRREKQAVNSDPKLGSIDKIRRVRKNRVQQIPKLKEEEEQQSLQDAENEEKRSLKRREAWEVKKEENASKESMENKSVPIIEIARARNVRERIFDPKNQQNFYDSGIVELSDPKVAARGRFNSNKETKDESYVALVESLENPRIFYYREKPQNEQRRSAQVLLTNPHFYDKKYESLEIVDDSSEEDEQGSDEFPASRELYIIDPSEYKGGEPVLKLYRDRLKPQKINTKTISRNSVFYNLYKIRRTNDNRVPGWRDPQENVQENLPRNLNTDELLRILIDAFNLQFDDKFFERLTKQNSNSDKQSIVRSFVAKPEREQSSDEVARSEEDDKFVEIRESDEVVEEDEDANDSREGNSNETLSRRLSRLRREAPDQTKMQTLEIQGLEEVSSPRILSDIDDVEKSMVQKIPLEKYTQKENLSVNYINDWRNVGGNGNEDRGLPSFIEGSIPKLENVVIDGLETAKNFTGSVERLIENLDKNFNETSESSEQSDSVNSELTATDHNAFYNAITNVKKFFMFLGGITHILRG
ncbi:uncharacterized protein LOC143346320 [Colletes latitarsis]|uniref:uncharacterized protein LOC143346320 n=1 Tax=Colletes latitarsis TaxID=2605962 RepID=UPI0040367AC2